MANGLSKLAAKAYLDTVERTANESGCRLTTRYGDTEVAFRAVPASGVEITVHKSGKLTIDHVSASDVARIIRALREGW